MIYGQPLSWPLAEMDMTIKATNPVMPWLGALLMAAVLTACGNRAAPPAALPEVVTDAGGGTFTLATTGASASAAVERGLNQATQFCADRNAMIAVQGTRIEPGGYRVAFRCLEGAPIPAPSMVTAQAREPLGVLGVAPAVGMAAPAGLGVSPTIAPPAPVDSLFAPSAPIAGSARGLPGATSPLQPIAGPPTARPAAPRGFGGGAQPASSFWQSGR